MRGTVMWFFQARKFDGKNIFHTPYTNFPARPLSKANNIIASKTLSLALLQNKLKQSFLNLP